MKNFQTDQGLNLQSCTCHINAWLLIFLEDEVMLWGNFDIRAGHMDKLIWQNTWT
jgi:hypothetical protein